MLWEQQMWMRWSPHTPLPSLSSSYWTVILVYLGLNYNCKDTCCLCAVCCEWVTVCVCCRSRCRSSPLSHACSHSSPPSILEPLLCWVYNAQHSCECREKQAVGEDPGLAFFFFFPLCFSFLLAFCKGTCSNQKIPWGFLPWDLCAQLVSPYFYQAVRSILHFLACRFQEWGKNYVKKTFFEVTEMLKCNSSTCHLSGDVNSLHIHCHWGGDFDILHKILSLDQQGLTTLASERGCGCSGWMGKRLSMPLWPWVIPCASFSCSW